MSGEVLSLLLIFNGQQNSRSEKRCSKCSLPCAFMPSKKSWMDEPMMDFWIQQWLSPWKDMLPSNAVLLLILGLPLKNQSQGIEVQNIVSSYTYSYRQLDNGMNNPTKKSLSDQWEDWVDTDGVGEGREIKTPSSKIIQHGL